nr:MAG TPA: hypothetical protein [Caudoviricetes sp.]
MFFLYKSVFFLILCIDNTTTLCYNIHVNRKGAKRK